MDSRFTHIGVVDLRSYFIYIYIHDVYDSIHGVFGIVLYSGCRIVPGQPSALSSNDPRFVLVLALVAVRAMMYQSFQAEGPLAPAFNVSAMVLILGQKK